MCQTHKDCICRETTKGGGGCTVTSERGGLGFNPSALVPPTVQGHAHEVAQMPTVQVKLVFFGQCQRGLVY